MNIDWPIALGIFLILIAWSFSYYGTLFNDRGEPLEDVIGDIADRIMDNLTIEVYEIPLRFNSLNSTTNSVLYLTFSWPFGKNSTRVFLDSTALSCNITGDTLYWRTNLNVGYNYFKMRFFNRSVAVNCTTSITPDGNESRVIPWAQEKSSMISQANINDMVATSYSIFKSNLGINRNFKVELNISGTITTYGLNTTGVSNVYATEKWSVIEETNQDVIVRIMAW